MTRRIQDRDGQTEQCCSTRGDETNIESQEERQNQPVPKDEESARVIERSPEEEHM
jgi:hypothetical protein